MLTPVDFVPRVVLEPCRDGDRWEVICSSEMGLVKILLEPSQFLKELITVKRANLAPVPCFLPCHVWPYLNSKIYILKQFPDVLG